MSVHYIKIEEVTGEKRTKVHQALKFPTGDFVWRIRFNQPLRAKTVNSNTCYVTTLDGQFLKTHISYNASQQYIEIEPLESYAQDVSYILTITGKVASSKGRQLSHDVSIRFKA